MRISIKFDSDEKFITLSVHHQHFIQSFIYHNISPELSDFLHNKGYTYEKRSFKLFTFSRLISSKVSVKNNQIQFKLPVHLIVSSPLDEFIISLADSMVLSKEFFIGNNKLFVSSIDVLMPPVFKNKSIIYFLSPVTVYSTLLSPDSKKKTYYYTPFEKEFYRLLKENLIKKYIAFYKKEPPEKIFEIRKHRIKRKDEKILIYKNTVIKGWMGEYEITGNIELLKFAYYAGLGSKNSQGFGLFEFKKL